MNDFVTAPLWLFSLREAFSRFLRGFAWASKIVSRFAPDCESDALGSIRTGSATCPFRLFQNIFKLMYDMAVALSGVCVALQRDGTGHGHC